MDKRLRKDKVVIKIVLIHREKIYLNFKLVLPKMECVSQGILLNLVLKLIKDRKSQNLKRKVPNMNMVGNYHKLKILSVQILEEI